MRTCNSIADNARKLAVGAAPLGHAAALANNARTLTVKAAPSEHSARGKGTCSGSNTIEACSSTCRQYEDTSSGVSAIRRYLPTISADACAISAAAVKLLPYLLPPVLLLPNMLPLMLLPPCTIMSAAVCCYCRACCCVCCYCQVCGYVRY